MEFINREKELQDLEKRWISGIPELFVVYGKRRVGKTELLKSFIKGKRAVYYLADKRTMVDQLAELARLVAKEFKDPSLAERGFTDWINFFQYIQTHNKERFALIVDEFPYLTEVDPATSSIFQKGWDEYLRSANVMLVLLGSSIAMMESEVLIQKSPLFGRRTGQLLLEPLTFQQSRQFFPGKSFADYLPQYSITGGMPAYILQMEAAKNIQENVISHIFPKTEFLHNEIRFVLREELREPKNYLAILRAIALGKRKLSEIVNETGIEKPSVNKYLNTLNHLQIVERELPITESKPEKSRKGLYRLQDIYFRFWFQYIFPYNSDLEIQRYEEVLLKISESFTEHVAFVYEEVCRELAGQWQDRIFVFERVGKWWGPNAEIDLVAFNSRTKDILFGECKWSDKLVGTDIYETLKKRARLVVWHLAGRREHFILFSKSGFTEHMKELAKKEKVILVEKDKLINL
jgi:AAA+ ATPase superfamily predicted ATPase